jgi:hypothetical protein
MRTKLALLVLLASQLTVLFGSASPVSWWEGL